MDNVGSCCCGQLKVRVVGELPKASICHCFQCQKRTGSAYGLQAAFRREHVSVEGETKTFTRHGEGEVCFSFCPDCGSTVLWELDGMPDHIIIAVGAFANQNFPAPVFSAYEDRLHHWVRLPDSITTHLD